ncbi:hypothetical protein [Paenibacillus ginsengarvi]|uniref:hypothetical protein n=1 Tax=Paenibacillus ginsengarvi TaxID=400777 RepID=UPI0011C4A67F|nr:hypothetical protein [Paenibacillus ginsengarvi]
MQGIVWSSNLKEAVKQFKNENTSKRNINGSSLSIVETKALVAGVPNKAQAQKVEVLSHWM